MPLRIHKMAHAARKLDKSAHKKAYKATLREPMVPDKHTLVDQKSGHWRRPVKESD